MKNHIAIVHEGKKVEIECNFCGDKFLARSEWREHVNKIHENVKPTCTYCNRNFLRQRSLDIHIYEHHEGNIRKFACTLCKSRFHRKAHLRTHNEFVHEGKKPFDCSFCDYKCSQRGVRISIFRKI